MILEIITLLTVAIIVYPKSLIPIGDFFKLIFKGFGKLIVEIITLTIKILTELLRFLGILIEKIFALLTSFFKWLINLF